MKFCCKVPLRLQIEVDGIPRTGHGLDIFGHDVGIDFGCFDTGTVHQFLHNSSCGTAHMTSFERYLFTNVPDNR
jgi:hypothetical protein